MRYGQCHACSRWLRLIERAGRWLIPSHTQRRRKTFSEPYSVCPGGNTSPIAREDRL